MSYIFKSGLLPFLLYSKAGPKMESLGQGLNGWCLQTQIEESGE